MVQLSHPYMTTRKTIALTRWTFVGEVMSLLFNRLSKLVITFLTGFKSLLIYIFMRYNGHMMKLKVYWKSSLLPS